MKKNIVIWSSHSKEGFSGGRYHACILAKALAKAGFRVYFACNQLPQFFYEIVEFSDSSNIIPLLCITSKGEVSFTTLPKEVFFYFVVPGGGLDFKTVLEGSKYQGARIALLNFESGNWFNLYSPLKRSLRSWASWQMIAEKADLILSSNQESCYYARKFYKTSPETLFDYAYPALNSSVLNYPREMIKEKRITIFVSEAPDTAHKGGEHLHTFFQDSFAGYTLTIISGKGSFSFSFVEQIKIKAKKYNVQLEWLSQISDYEKYSVLSKTELLLFPSLFEGFGYPPVEALNCGAAVIAFDLPVVRESCGESVIYAEHGNWDDFKEKIDLFLTGKLKKPSISQHVFHIARIETMAHRLSSVLEKFPERKLPRRSKALTFFSKRKNSSVLKNKFEILIYPEFTSEKEKDFFIKKLANLFPVLFAKSPYKLKFFSYKKFFSFVPHRNNSEKDLLTASNILVWKESLTKTEEKRLEGLEENLLFLDGEIDFPYLEKFRSMCNSLSLSHSEKNQLIAKNKAQFTALHSQILRSGKTKALLWQDAGKFSLDSKDLSTKAVRLADESILLDEGALASYQPQIIFVKNFTKILLGKKGFEAFKVNLLNFFLLGEKNYLIVEFDEGLSLVNLFPTFQDRIILIPESSHTSPWNLHRSFLLPKREIDSLGPFKAIIGTLFNSASELKIVT
jgi:glycosyltransferase involved in cell wall biosynthesis